MRPTFLCSRSGLLRLAAPLTPRRTPQRSFHINCPARQTATAFLRPIPAAVTAQISAFRERTKISIADDHTLLDAITHPSYRYNDTVNVDGDRFFRLQLLGDKVLNLYVAEYILAKYPQLPAPSVSSVAEAYIGTRAMAGVAKTFGIQNVMRWKGSKVPDTPGEAVIAGRVMQALLGAIYQENGMVAARDFIIANILSRAVDMETHLKLAHPKTVLAAVAKSKKLSKPVSRLLKETGRLSHAPVFVVGVYSGVQKIGEGYGSSLKMAEARAVTDALKRHYLEEVKNVKLPSEIDEDSTTFFEDEAVAAAKQ
ncbi:ribonuclease III domain-containing protein [Gaertneriomyces semiglobifer]|nr:ribonuclease III domain-containing protein [Gaertneriomyces semiglobifer]